MSSGHSSFRIICSAVCMPVNIIGFILIYTLVSCPLISASSVEEKILNRINGSEPESLDPQKITSSSAVNIVNDLFEGLVTRDRSGRIIPAQASHWDISPDNKTYTFYLIPAKWSDNKPVTARDYVFAWQRAVNPVTASPYAWYPSMAGILNAEAIIKGKLPVDKLGVKAVNDRTLKVTLSRSIPWFMELLAHPVLFPVPWHAIEHYGNGWTQAGHMVSNGSYRLTSWVVNESVTLSANPYYRDYSNVQINKVRWFSTSSSITALHRYKAGSIDITANIPTDSFKAVQKEMPENIFTLPQAGTEYLAFNMRKPPMNNKKLRQALSYAIDRKILVKYVLGQGQIAARQFTPYYLNNAPEISAPYANLTDKERIAKARQFYKEAGYSASHPLELTLIYNTSETHKKVMLAIAHMWKKTLGADVTIENQEWKTLLDRLQSGDFEVGRASWIADYDHVSAMLSHFVRGQNNKAGYSNPEYDKIFLSSYSEKKPQYQKSYARLEEKLAEDMPIAPLFYYVSSRLVSSRVGGYYASSLDQIYTRYLWIKKHAAG